jgi:alpha-N-arabinofuranosidase
MSAIDPTIRFIAVGDNDMAWNRAVLSAVGNQTDYLAIHHYYGGDSVQRDIRNLMARPLQLERFYTEVAALIHEVVPNHPVRLAINEWGLDLPESRQYSMEAALYGGRLMNVFERAAPLVAMSAVSDMVNGWPGGIVQAGRTSVFVSPVYHVNAMYARRLGVQRLQTIVDGPTFNSSREGQSVPVLDAVASRSADGRAIYIKLVNTDASRALQTRFEIRGANVAGSGERDLLSASGATRSSREATDSQPARSSRCFFRGNRFQL